MALMFPRLAHNFIKNGYFPTDELTLERVLQALSPSPGTMNVLDGSAGEGVAIAEVSHALGRDSTTAFAVEYDLERANHSRTLVDHCIHGDLMDTVISQRSMGLIWLNPPYGDLLRDYEGKYQGKGRPRLEKLFYQRTVPSLQFDGILVFIVPYYTLDAELIGWLTTQFSDLCVYRAAEAQFKQIVILGRRVRRTDIHSSMARAAREKLTAVGAGELTPEEIPETWTLSTYTVPTALSPPEHFYLVEMEPTQLSTEILRLGGLWDAAEKHLSGASKHRVRPPARPLSRWHLALALAAGAISGVVKSPSGKHLVVKGDTHKGKTVKTEYSEDAEGNLVETRTHTDRFIPVIRAWDMTPGSPTRGEILTIR